MIPEWWSKCIAELLQQAAIAKRFVILVVPGEVPAVWMQQEWVDKRVREKHWLRRLHLPVDHETRS